MSKKSKGTKSKLRKQNKLFGLFERAGNWHWETRKTIEMITYFDCENNDLYCQAINYYSSLPFSTHKLWIEIVDANTSRLIVSWNKVNPRMTKDLSNFWCIYYSLKYEKDNSVYKHYYATISEAMEHIMNNYNEPKTTKEKYLEYRENIKRKGK